MKKWTMLTAAGMAALCVAVTPITSFAWGLKSNTQTESTKSESYSFTYKETAVVMGAEAAPIINALGTPKKTFEQDSCAYQGKDKVYTYDGFEVSTYPVNGKDCIASVYFLDTTVSTPEGIKIGSSYDDMIKAYGKNYKAENGVYRYTLGKSELAVYTTNNVVDAVEYMVIAE